MINYTEEESIEILKGFVRTFKRIKDSPTSSKESKAEASRVLQQIARNPSVRAAGIEVIS